MVTSTIQLIKQAQQAAPKTAIIAQEGHFTYQQLLDASHQVAATLLDGAGDLQEMRVAFLLPPGFQYVATMWGVWRAGGIAVPLAVSHPPPELQYVIEDSQADVVIAHPDFEAKLRPIAEALERHFLPSDHLFEAAPTELPAVDLDRRAMIIYTSGTTGRPKGVVSTHRNIQAQITTLIEAWGWQPDDHILHTLPLHHVHGVINVLSCALWAGAICEILPKFDTDQVWERFINSDLTLFMAVPTIYNRLIAAWEAAPPERQQAMSAACRKMRLMVSGSAALPVSVLEQWREISGHTLLERYGMSEIGMGLSNPLHGERRPGHVGQPLPGVEMRRVDEAGQVIEADDVPGELEVKGPSVFKEYWQRPEATAKAFVEGWFRTGDIAVIEDGTYRLLGRSSVDIIKTGGYKVSALEVEEVLRTHPAIQECAVVGVEDVNWGEAICAAVVLKAEQTLEPDHLRSWAKEQLAPYKVPGRVKVVGDLPRNAMGKVTKPKVKEFF